MSADMLRSIEPKNSREDLQRILYEIVCFYEDACLHLGGDSELLRDRIRIGKQMLQENHWWPAEPFMERP